ncbi:MAG: ABC transporter permease [Candidatus Moraniibacteriota bacterium]
MLIPDLLKLSLRMFKARTMRTLLTILGMSVGIAAIIFLVSLGYGLQRTLLQRITTSDALVSLDVTGSQEGRGLILNQTGIDNLQSVPDVVQVTPVLELPGQAKFQSLTLDINTVSSESGFQKSEGLKVVAGRFFSETSSSETVVTEDLAAVLGISPEEILGQKVSFTLFPKSAPGSNRADTFAPPTEYTVVGVVVGENSAYLPLRSLSSLSIDSFSKIKVKASSTNSVNQVRQVIETRGFLVSSISETVDQANKVFRAVQIILMIFGMIALIVSAIGMFNTMTIALLERTEEIGIMKAIGASRTDISLMFVMESTMMGFLGSVGGVILGIIEGEIINVLINMIASRFGGEAVDLFYSPLWFIGVVIAFGAFVGFLTGVFPARTASKIDALEALRYK